MGRLSRGCELVILNRLSVVRHVGIFLLGLVMILMSNTNALSGEGVSMIILRPVENASLEKKVASNNEVYEVRKGVVSLDTRAFYQRAAENTLSNNNSPVLMKDKTVQLNFFPQKGFNVMIERENRLDNNVILLSGKVIGLDISTVTVTITPDFYIINLQDMPNSTIYRVVGNTLTGIGTVTEIDQKKIPPMINLPPLIPPTNE
jgi:hypothetical protein